jgi:hypothetical protein
VLGLIMVMLVVQWAIDLVLEFFFPIDDPTMIEIEHIHRLVVTLTTNLVILLGYLTIFFIICNHYTKYIEDENERANVRRNLVSLAIMFLSICLIYIIRIIRDI